MRLLASLLFLAATSQGSAFSTLTYQGHLQDADGPFNGTVAMSFALFDAEAGGSQVGTSIDRPQVEVSNGLFQVALDFGEQRYANGLWLAIEVEGQALEPRQPITGAAFAIDLEPPDVPMPPDPQDCQDYCDAMMIGCPGEYPDQQQCLDTCSAFSGEGEVGDDTGDTLQCRATWLQRGFEGEIPVSEACQNAAADSPECVD